jgi:hypothetical protein
MIHAFDDNIALTVGVKGAIILNHIAWWVKRNEASNINFHDGYYWTFNSADSYAKILPFWTGNVIQKELRKLENDGYIKGGCYNKLPMDRTKWYTLTKKGQDLCGCIPQEGGNDSAKQRNGFSEKKFSTIDHNKHTSIKHSNTRVHAQECSPELSEALIAFEEHRKKLKKPMTDYAKKLLLSKLQKMAHTEEQQIAILNQSIENGWQGVFPLGGEKKGYNRPTAADMAEQAMELLRKRGTDNDGTGTGNDDGNADSRPAWVSFQ